MLSTYTARSCWTAFWIGTWLCVSCQWGFFLCKWTVSSY